MQNSSSIGLVVSEKKWNRQTDKRSVFYHHVYIFTYAHTQICSSWFFVVVFEVVWFWSPTWTSMTSLKFGTFFRDETHRNWKWSNSFKNQYLSTYFGYKVYLYIQSILKWKITIFVKFLHFNDFADRPKISELGHLWEIPNLDTFLIYQYIIDIASTI